MTGRQFDMLTFDCYGTLIDWETGIAEAFQETAAADGVRLDRAAVLRVLFDTRPAAEAPEYQTYRDQRRPQATQERWLRAQHPVERCAIWMCGSRCS
jgi:FMN phosphatase YigB (HAD superfamily)